MTPARDRPSAATTTPELAGAGRTRLLRGAFLTLLYGAVLGCVLPLFFLRPGVYEGRFSIVRMLEGTADRPFVYRTLTPDLANATVAAGRGLAAAAGVDPAQTIPALLGAWLLRATRAPAAVRPYALEFGVVAFLTSLALAGFAWAMARLVRLFYPGVPGFVAVVLPALALLAVPILFFRNFNCLYDPATLCLFTLGLLWIASRRRLAYAVTFPLAVLNKETAALLIPLFLLREAGARPRLPVWIHAASQLVVVVLVKLWLTHRFAANPGAFFESHLGYNAGLLARAPFYWKALPVVAIAALFVARDWRAKPAFLRRGLVLSLLPMVAAIAVVGLLDELRDYYEVYPFVLLLALPTALRALGIAADPHVTGAAREAGPPAGAAGGAPSREEPAGP